MKLLINVEDDKEAAGYLKRALSDPDAVDYAAAEARPG